MYPYHQKTLSNKYTDIGVDLQYEHLFNKTNFIIHGSYVHELQNLNAFLTDTAAQYKSNYLNSLRDAEVYFNNKFGITLGYFTTMGSSDTLLYPKGAIGGNYLGSPKSDGVIAEFDFMPLRNTKFSIQYTAYHNFNGARGNYDGFSRSAADNNTLYFLVWLCF